MQKKDTVVFDLDGTLLDTLDDLKNSVNYAWRAMVIRPGRKTRFGGLWVTVFCCSCSGRCLRDRENPDFDKVFSCFKEHYGIHCNDLTKPYDGNHGVAGAAERKRRQDGHCPPTRADFAVKELSEIYFKGIIPVAIGEKESEGIRKKPAPDTVMEALRQLGSTTEHAVYVGDSRGGSGHGEELRYGLHFM